MTEIVLCPKCMGQGTVSMPPHIDGDVSFWIDSASGGYTCKVCGGQGYIRLREETINASH